MKLSGLSLIGDRHGTTGGKTFTGINPADGAPLPVEFHSASNAEVNTAAELAAAAFLTYARWSGARRAALLNRIAERLEANGAEIIARAHLETGLPAARLQGELTRTCFQMRQYGQGAASGLAAGLRIDQTDPDRKPLPKPDLRSLLVPLGPVAVFGASNFPLAYSVAGGDTASALAAGCPVIVKAHPAHPGTSEIIGTFIEQAVRESGAPAGTFSLLFDAGHEAGTALVQHPLIKAVGFTGSRRGGRALMDLAAARPEPIPVYAEMSSINPVCILAGALRERAEEIATGLHASVTLGVGQFCTKPGLILVEAGTGAGGEADALLAKLSTLTAGSSPATMLTPGICLAYRFGVETFSGSTGVKCLAKVDSGIGPARAGAALLETDAKTFLENRGLMTEIFGPATLLVKCSSVAQMLEVVGRLEGQLTATIHATPEELAIHPNLIFALGSKAGRLVYNGFPTGVEVTHAMTHGGPYPATSDGRSTSVGTRAIERFQRPLTFQNFPDAALPPELQAANPLGFARLCDGVVTTAAALCLLFFSILELSAAST
jgi:NADP-dependent aldehyde dehydrogenase